MSAVRLRPDDCYLSGSLSVVGCFEQGIHFLGLFGHVQRGGSPTVRDRVAGSQMGYKAVELLKEGIGNRVVAMQKDEIVDFDIFEALNMKKTIDLNLYKIAHEISI